MRQIGHIRFLNWILVREDRVLHVPVVVLDAALTKLVQTLAHDSWVLVDTGADLTQECGVLDLLKQLNTYFFVIWLV